MKKFKKSLATTAAALISFSSICSGSVQPLIGSADTVNTEVYAYESFFYKQVDSDDNGTYDHVEILDCDRMTSEIDIPSEIDGLPVSSIGDTAFANNSALVSVTIPDSVTSIGEAAFANSPGLTSVTIPDNTASIGTGAFSYCSCLENINVSEYNNDFSSVDGVLFNKEKTELIQYPMGKTESEYTIPDSVKTIGYGAFSGSSDLTSITIPDNVTSIGKWAFSECSSLTSITIPDGVTSIEYETFFGCSALTKLTIPDSVTSIGSTAFCGCSSLTEVAIPGGVTSIEPCTFDDCTALTSITIPDGVTSIGFSAFSRCTSLTSIIIPDNVTSIGSNAFYNCTGLTNITIPDSVTSIEYEAFSECTNLENINVSENNSNYSSIDGVLFNKEKTQLIQFPIANIQSEYTIPDSVTSIAKYAFFYCSGLTNVTIPDSVTSIEYEAFRYCTSLASITIPDGVTAIEHDTFGYCTSLTSVTIPDSVTSIGGDAFYGCSSLSNITIPDSVTSIGSGAFRECTGLTDVTIPYSVTSIEYGAFKSCKNLTSITIKNPECEIYNNSATISNNYGFFQDFSYKGVICGYENSTAQAYAETYGYKFESLSNSPFLRGDISGNGKIDLSDAIEIAKYMAGKRQFTNEEMKIADLNEDGRVNLQDAIEVAKYMAKNHSSDNKTASADLTAGMKSQSVTGAEADEEFVLGQTEFALNLFKNTVSDKENTLISPYSVMQALAMTANGADNNTKTQMERVLGGMPIEKLNEYLYTWRTSQSFSTANSIWYRNNLDSFTVLPEFLQRNADYYNASAYSSPFDDTTVKDINNWVSEKTNEMIPKLLDNIPEAACMYLINAVAFDAKWQNKYSDNNVNEDGDFKAFDGSSQKVTMMSSTEHQYLEDENATGFYKYYEDERYAFAALLPKEGISVSEYINTLTPESLYNTLSNTRKTKVRAAIPKFSYDYDVTLNDTLSDMGMSDAFDGLNADFTKMIKSKENIYISSVLHKTHIEVTEEGTKAAAVTGVIMAPTAAPIDEIKYVTLDRPFVYCIVDTQTSLPVFIGAVNSVEG